MATHNFNITEVLETQSQKATTVNDGLFILDAVAGGYVLGVSSQPPASPVDGTVWVVSANGAGIWSAKDTQLAIRVGGAWRYVEPRTGISFVNNENNTTIKFNGTSWGVIAATGIAEVSADAKYVQPSNITGGGTIEIFTSGNTVRVSSAAGGGGGGGSVVFYDVTLASPTTLDVFTKVDLPTGVRDVEVTIACPSAPTYLPALQVNEIATSAYVYARNYTTTPTTNSVIYTADGTRFVMGFTASLFTGRRCNINMRIQQVLVSGGVTIQGFTTIPGQHVCFVGGEMHNPAADTFKSISFASVSTNGLPTGTRIRMRTME